VFDLVAEVGGGGLPGVVGDDVFVLYLLLGAVVVVGALRLLVGDG
jgi:hypothetical protein